jgi:hypothetical protein
LGLVGLIQDSEEERQGMCVFTVKEGEKIVVVVAAVGLNRSDLRSMLLIRSAFRMAAFAEVGGCIIEASGLA